MQKSDSNSTTKTAHRKVQSSTTLNRKYVKRPSRSVDMMVQVKRSPKLKHFSGDILPNKAIAKEQPIAPAVAHPMQTRANEKIRRKAEIASSPVRKMTAKELKDQAIRKALANAAKSVENEEARKTEIGNEPKVSKLNFGLGRVVLALSCAVAAIFAIVYFVNLNMPDISMRVAAVQTGIDASYPGYIPQGFSLSGIASENEKITLNFKSSEGDDVFSLTEEQSSWDSNALLVNFVKEEYGENYSIVREQGLTIYISDSNATWVNGGMLYKIYSESGVLTKKQINSIATSL